MSQTLLLRFKIYVSESNQLDRKALASILSFAIEKADDHKDWPKVKSGHHVYVEQFFDSYHGDGAFEFWMSGKH